MMAQISESDLMYFDVCGRGTSSLVKKAIHLPTHKLLALKVMNVSVKSMRESILQEMRALCDSPDQPGLVNFFGAFFVADTQQMSIALEYCDCGSLSDVLSRAQAARGSAAIPLPVLARITGSVLEGLAHLHTARRMVHRDIKPANILLNMDGSSKITDFGISSGLDSTLAKCSTYVGTVTYMSPERIESLGYGYPADVWSLGVTLLECAAGAYPYDAAKGALPLMMAIVSDDPPVWAAAPGDAAGTEFASFIASCLHKDPSQRSTAEALRSHPWLARHGGAKEAASVHNAHVATFLSTVYDPQERLLSTAQLFVAHYYLLFDGEAARRAQLASLYRDGSRLTFEGEHATGRAAITAALQAKATALAAHIGASGRRLVRTGGAGGGVYVDVQRSGAHDSGLLVLVNGRVGLGRPGSGAGTTGGARGGGGGDVTIAFAETFLLLPAGPGEHWIAHQVFRVLPESRR